MLFALALSAALSATPYQPYQPIPEIPSIIPLESEPKADEPKEYIIPDRRENINGNYIDQDDHLKKIDGNDHLKYMDDLNTSEKSTCVVVGNIMDCS